MSKLDELRVSMTELKNKTSETRKTTQIVVCKFADGIDETITNIHNDVNNATHFACKATCVAGDSYDLDTARKACNYAYEAVTIATCLSTIADTIASTIADIAGKNHLLTGSYADYFADTVTNTRDAAIAIRASVDHAKDATADAAKRYDFIKKTIN